MATAAATAGPATLTAGAAAPANTFDDFVCSGKAVVCALGGMIMVVEVSDVDAAVDEVLDVVT